MLAVLDNENDIMNAGNSQQSDNKGVAIYIRNIYKQ
jgi:hypothetical protein